MWFRRSADPAPRRGTAPRSVRGGAVLFELLTGELPFQGSTTVGVMMGRILEAPPDPRSKNPEIPEAAAALVLRLMAKKREDRHGSAEEVAAALRTLRHLALHAPRSAGPRRVATADEPTLMIEVGAEPTGDAVAAGAVRGARGRAPVELAPEPAPPLRKTVAVLPLVNHAGREDQLLVDGLTEALIDALSGMEEVRVLSRGVVSQPALAGLTPRSAGQVLGAQSTLSGSVQRAGADLVVSLQLLSVKDGIQVMARRYQRTGAAAAILGVTDEAARDVAAALAAPDQAVSLGPLSDPRVAELYLRARQSYHRSGMINVSESCTLFEQALALTPNDPTLLSYNAMAQARRWFFGGEGAGERAYRTAEQAVALAPRRGEPFLALATVRFQSLDHAGAIAAVREALARMPALVDGYDIVGHLLMEAGPLRSGLQYLEYALALDPGLHRAHLDIARAYALRGAWDQAEQQITKAGTASPRSTALWVTRARLTLWQRDRAAAAELLTRPNLPPAEYPLARRLLEVITSGQPAPVEELFGSGTPWQLSSPRSRVWRLQLTAEVQAFCGAHADALRTIEQAIDAKLIDLMWLERCPLLAPLRKAARWPALRQTMEGRAAGVHRALGWPTTTAQAAAARG